MKPFRTSPGVTAAIDASAYNKWSFLLYTRPSGRLILTGADPRDLTYNPDSALLILRHPQLVDLPTNITEASFHWESTQNGADNRCRGVMRLVSEGKTGSSSAGGLAFYAYDLEKVMSDWEYPPGYDFDHAERLRQSAYAVDADPLLQSISGDDLEWQSGGLPLNIAKFFIIRKELAIGTFSFAHLDWLCWPSKMHRVRMRLATQRDVDRVPILARFHDHFEDRRSRPILIECDEGVFAVAPSSVSVTFTEDPVAPDYTGPLWVGGPPISQL